jgi:anti-sigma regulatory factor (Ser/Thr protein kinase)
MTLACAEQDDVLRIDSASADDLERLHPWFDAVSGRLPPAIWHGMRVALEEVVLNAANHGFAANASGEITVQLQIGPLSAALCVEDPGRPFDPAKAPAHRPAAHLLDAPPGQLGLVLLHHYCHDLTYERVGQRNRLIMRFPFPAT